MYIEVEWFATFAPAHIVDFLPQKYEPHEPEHE